MIGSPKKTVETVKLTPKQVKEIGALLNRVSGADTVGIRRRYPDDKEFIKFALEYLDTRDSIVGVEKLLLMFPEAKFWATLFGPFWVEREVLELILYKLSSHINREPSKIGNVREYIEVGQRMAALRGGDPYATHVTPEELIEQCEALLQVLLKERLQKEWPVLSPEPGQPTLTEATPTLTPLQMLKSGAAKESAAPQMPSTSTEQSVLCVSERKMKQK